MAKQMKGFEFRSGVGGDSNYDWDSWLDGSTLMLTEGEDYTCTTQTFSSLARARARKDGKTLRTNTVPNDDYPNEKPGIVIQAVEASDEQKAEWERLDEAAKGRAAERRAAKKAGQGADSTEASTAREHTAPTPAAKPSAPAPKPVVPGKKK